MSPLIVCGLQPHTVGSWNSYYELLVEARRLPHDLVPFSIVELTSLVSENLNANGSIPEPFADTAFWPFDSRR